MTTTTCVFYTPINTHTLFHYTLTSLLLFLNVIEKHCVFVCGLRCSRCPLIRSYKLADVRRDTIMLRTERGMMSRFAPCILCEKNIIQPRALPFSGFFQNYRFQFHCNLPTTRRRRDASCCCYFYSLNFAE